MFPVLPLRLLASTPMPSVSTSFFPSAGSSVAAPTINQSWVGFFQAASPASPMSGVVSAATAPTAITDNSRSVRMGGLPGNGGGVHENDATHKKLTTELVGTAP